ncbi:DNA breaking-rejoining protein [Kosakonia radicincitans UMEnt01/12]|uniref:ATP-binding protein n=1 Tax=Kosakonia radicincitans TaxID=283686 RepID=UPI000461B46A|nr:ATP-binding protein [Kosakonia radicincitans]KDE37363.1 DNA breaking-rejoining protein [Kosakonia radicincitans UMEnt01/12]
MSNPFDQMVARMDAATTRQMGRTVTINGNDYDAVESQFVAEMGPVLGEGLSLVVFSDQYQPRRDDVVTWRGEQYRVTRHQAFNNKPQIWIE